MFFNLILTKFPGPPANGQSHEHSKLKQLSPYCNAPRSPADDVTRQTEWSIDKHEPICWSSFQSYNNLRVEVAEYQE